MTWHTVDLSELIAKIESGGRPHGGASVDSGEIPSLGGENIRLSGGLELEKIKKVPLSFFDHMTKGILQNEDVLINKDGANTGKVGFYENQFPKASINEHVFLLRGYPSLVEQRYLYYLLLSQYSQGIIRSKISGSAQPGLKSDFIRHFPITLPTSIIEQSKISEILLIMDYAIEITKDLILKQCQVKTGFLQDQLTSGIDENGQIRNSNSHKYKHSPFGPIPEEWEISTLERISHRITSGSRWWAKYYSDIGAKFIRIGNLTREHINLKLDDIQHVHPPVGSEAQRTALEYGDLLISITADLGIIGVVPVDLGESYINQHIALVKLNKEIVNPWWVGNFLSGTEAQKQISMLNESGAKAGMNLKTIADFPIILPKKSEQDEIAEIIRQIDVQIQTKKEYLAKLQRLRFGLMQDLIGGRISVLSILTQIRG